MKNSGCSARELVISVGLRCLVTTLLVPGLWAQAVLTWHNDAARTGQYPVETLLSPSNVNSTNFGLKFSLSVDSTVDAQPLYVPGLSFSGVTHNVLYVVTENDSIYAFDADAGGASLWPSHTVLLGGETASDTGCGQVSPTVGITSTPAIDPTYGPNGTIFFVAMTKDNSGHYHQRLHAWDLVLGTEESGWPIEVAATYPGNGPNSSGGVLTFDPKQYKERAGLLISNGVIYTTWASNCDQAPYNGWVIGYNESTQAQTVLNLTPNGTQGAIWQAGAGPAADAGGNLYFLTGNGTFDTTLTNGFPSQGDYGNAFMKLSTTSGLAVADYFTMFNTVSESAGDLDLGSGGAMLLPVLNDAGGNPHELAVGAGKDGNAYVVDRNSMGKYNSGSNAVYQQFPLGSAVYSSPAWFNNTLYYGPTNSPISAYASSLALFGTSPSSQTTSHSFGYRGATPAISATGSTNGIVWASDTPSSGSAAVLYAYDATNLNTELYDSTQAGSRDSFGTGITFATPTVANGKVFVGTTNSVAVFGLLNCSYGGPPISFSIPTSSATNTEIGVTTTTGCSWTAATTSNFITITRVDNTGGLVYFDVAANPGTLRSGTLTVAGHVVTITQPGALGAAPSNPSPANASIGVSINPTLSWTGTSGATSYDVYFGTSPNPPLITNTASTSYAPGSLNPGITYYWMVVAKNSAGTVSSPVWSFITSNATVTAVSVSPNPGSGASQTFAATYSDSGGASAITAAYILVGSSTTSAGSCWIQFNAGSNTYQLMNDAGTAWSAPVSVGSGSAGNSQCTLSGAGAGATPSGNNLTVNFPLTFAAGYAGAKNVYLNVVDGSGLSSGWQQLGSFTVTSGGGGSSGPVPVCNPQGFPCVVSLTPTNGTGFGTTFTGVFTHSGGATQHYLGYILFLPTPNIVWYTATGSCLVEYNRISNAMRLINDAGTNWLPGIIGLPIGRVGSLTNSHCTLNVGESSATINGTVMTVNAAVTFNPSFTGHLATFMQGFDVTGAYTGMTQFGNWEVYAGTQRPGPYVVDVSPTSGSGSSSTFTFTAGHTSGVSSLSFVTMLISSVIVGGTPCQAFYFQAANVLNLVNDTGTAMVSTNGIAPGTAGTLANSRCSIDTGSASASVSGDNVTVTLPMTFDPSTFGGVKNIYLNAFDDFGKLSHWVTSATWIVQ